MDSTCLYLTASTRQVFKETPGFEDVHPSDLELAWYKLDGTHICSAQVRPTWPPSSPAQKYDMREFNTQPRVFLNDAILCYDFSRPYRRNPAALDEEENENMFIEALTDEPQDPPWENTSSDEEENENMFTEALTDELQDPPWENTSTGGDVDEDHDL